MKKLAIFAFALLLVVAFTLPATALESQFGGYWRTRFFAEKSFDANDDADAQDLIRVDTRTRLYYTAIFHENLKFVNKFEFNSTWGDTNGGKIGADGTGILRIKNSYADFNLGPVNTKVGIQGMALARGFIFDDDFSGLVINFKGESFQIPVFWVKAWEGGMGKDANDFDVDYYGIAPSFTIADKFGIKPYFMLAYSSDASAWTQVGAFSNTEDLTLWYFGVDFDVDFDMFSLWATGIYQGGDMDLKTSVNGSDNWDFSAWLFALGAKFGMNWGDIHGQFFYASGDDDATDTDWENFWVPRGQSYYWSEIMGLGVFDVQTSNNAPGDKISNVFAGNVGASFKPMNKLKISCDIWYAQLAENIVTANGSEEDYLGTEVDLKLTYQLLQGLNLDVIGAYLFAGDATTMNVPNDANPYEVGARLSLSF